MHWIHSLGYVGPGPGLNMVWAFVGLLATVLLAVFSVLFWPIRRMIRRLRGNRAAAAATVDSAEGSDSRQTANV